MKVWLFSAIVAALLFLSGNYIRRRTGGRVRYPELHLAAFLPMLAFIAYAVFWQGISDVSVPAVAIISLAFPAIVYFMFFWDRIFATAAWRKNEERIDADEARLSEERRHRERIEAYKHGKRPIVVPRPAQTGDGGGLIIPAPLPMPSPASHGPGTASSMKGHAGADRNGFRTLEGWRLRLAVSLQCVMICSVALSLLCELDNVFRMSAPVGPMFFACTGAAAIASSLPIALLTRGWAFFVPTLAMGVSIAGVLTGFRLLDATANSALAVQFAAYYGAKFMIGGSVVLLLWSVSALLSFSWKRKT